MAKSLKKCIETLTKSGELSQDLASDIQGAVTSLVAEGYTAKDAAVAAINDALSDLRAELADVEKQMQKSGGGIELSKEMRAELDRAIAERTGGMIAEPAKADYADAYENVETRPGTTDKQRDEGRDALDAIESAERRILGPASSLRGNQAAVLGSAISRDFREDGGTSFIGKQVTTTGDLALLGQVLRDPRFETFRIFFTDESGAIVGQSSYSSRLPGAVYLPDNFSEQVAADKAKFGASGYWLMHNHPSGRVEASRSDEVLTGKTASKVPGFQGHVILDFNEYGVVEAVPGPSSDMSDMHGRSYAVSAPELASKDLLGNPEVPHAMLGSSINNPTDLAMAGKKLQVDPNVAVLIGTDANNRITLIIEVAEWALTAQGATKSQSLRALSSVRRASREAGLSRVFAVVPGSLDQYHAATQIGFLTDVVDSSGKSAASLGRMSGVGALPVSNANKTGMKLRASQAGYGSPRQQPIPAVGAAATPSPTRQTQAPLQGGISGSQSTWNQMQDSKLDNLNDLVKFEGSNSALNDVSADRESAITRAIDRAIAMEQGKEVAPLRRLMVRNRLGKLRADLESGKIEDGAFIFDVNQLHRQMEDAYQARQLEPHKGRERGADWIRQKLLEAKRRGDISEQAADMAEWFVLQNPSLVDDLGISLRTRKDGAASGNYNPMNRVMTLFKGEASDTTAVHEILHHLERMMPAEMQEQIRLEWIKQVTKELQKSQKAGDQKRIDYFTAVLAGDQKKATEILTGRSMGGFNSVSEQFRKVNVNSPKFLRWFGNSKVVDSEGKPLVVYHGTASDFTEFSRAAEAKHIPLPGFFFTPHTEYANRFAESAGKEFRDSDGYIAGTEGGNVMPAYVSLKNTIEIDAGAGVNKGMYPASVIREILLDAQKKGYDGAIIRGWQDGSGPVQYVAFRPEQIKSAISNTGEFSETNPDIRQDLDIGRDYRYLNPSEFWAVSMTDAVSSRFKSKDSIWSRSLQWLREALEHIKSVLGLDSTYPMLKAMESIAKGDGSFVSREMLGSAQVYAAPSLWNKSLPAEKPRAKTRIIGDSGREYTADQQVMFRQTGREVDSITTLGKIRQWASLNWKQGIFDQFQPVRSITDKGYTLLRLSKGATGAFEALMHHGKLSLRDGAYDADTSGGVMQEVFIPLGKETTDFLYWIAGNRAERLAMEGKERLFSAQDIAAAKSLAQGTTDFDYVLASGKVTRDRTLIYSDSLARFNAFNKNVMDMAEQSGLIDGASRHLWEHEFYVPFYRVVDEKDGGVRGMNIKTGVIRQEAFKKLKGGKEGLNDLLANTLMNWAHLIDASAKNRAAKETLEAAGRLGAAAKAVPGEKNTVWYMDGGKRVEYSISDPELLVAISSLDYTGLRGGAMDALSMMKHWLTIGVTASPFFKVRNLIRDSVQAVATSGLSYNIAGNVVNGMRLTNRENPEYVSALAGGGLIRFGTMLEGNEAARTRQLIKKGAKDEHILDNETKLRAFYDKWLEPGISAYNELGNRGEEINRMSLYDQLIKQGVDHATASLMARDLMDFSMQGSWTAVRFLAQTVPFFNARLQGMYKLGRSIKGDPAKFVVVLGVVALLSLSLMMAYDDDDDWKKREDWDRDNYWWFKFGGIAYRIPKPFEIGAMATFAERSAELMFSNEMTGKRFREVTWKLLMDQLSMNPVPQLVKPIIDIYANTDSFTKRPIETMGMERLDRERRFNSNTSMPARGLSAAIGGALSPVQIDHLVRGYFGWLGAFAIGAGDIAVRLADDSPDRPSLDYWKFATGGMIAELDSAGSRYVTQMYQQAKEIETAYGTWRDLQKQAGRMQGAAQESAAKDAAEYRKQHQTEIRQYSQIESAKRHISGMNERIRRIEQSNMSSREKRDAIVNINKLKNQTAKRLVTAHTD